MAKNSRTRQKASELGAPDVETMVARIPHLRRLLTNDQIDQLQTMIDGTALNPIYEEEYRKAMRNAVDARAGNLVIYDPRKKRKARRVLDKFVRFHESDGHVRVDHNKMLTADALMPKTNNPDEANYLNKVRQILSSKGVWLRVARPWSKRGPEDVDWNCWFSLGYDGDVIETKDAYIDREELLDTTMLGAGYYRSVMTGEVQTRLKRAFRQFDSQWEIGWSKHMDLQQTRDDAPAGVPWISDKLGGAKFPSFKMWKRAHDLRMKAWEANAGGDVVAAQVHLLVALHVLEHNAQLLADYVDDTVGGAAKAVTILKVAKTSGQVAEGVLLIVGVGAGLKALRAAGTGAMSQKARYELADEFVKQYAKKNGISEAELRAVRYVPGPKGTTLGNMRGGHSAGYGKGWETWP